MKTRKLMTAIAIVLVLAVISARAAAQVEPTIKANIPFSFRAGETLMPAGSYRIRQVTRIWNMLEIEHNTDLVMLPAGNWEVPRNPVAKLIFRRYGDAYFLAQVWMADRRSELFQTKLEREYAARLRGETTVVLAEK